MAASRVDEGGIHIVRLLFPLVLSMVLFCTAFSCRPLLLSLSITSHSGPSLAFGIKFTSFPHYARMDGLHTIVSFMDEIGGWRLCVLKHRSSG